MAKELFSIASQEYKEPAYEVKKRKKIVIGALVACIVFIGFGFYEFRGFTNAASFYQSIAIRENQIVLINVSFWFLGALSALFLAAFLGHKPFWIIPFFVTGIIEISMVVVSNSLGFKIFTGRTLSSAYIGLFALCCIIPAMTVVLIAEQNQKKRSKNRENK